MMQYRLAECVLNWCQQPKRRDPSMESGILDQSESSSWRTSAMVWRGRKYTPAGLLNLSVNEYHFGFQPRYVNVTDQVLSIIFNGYPLPYGKADMTYKPSTPFSVFSVILFFLFSVICSVSLFVFTFRFPRHFTSSLTTLARNFRTWLVLTSPV